VFNLKEKYEECIKKRSLKKTEPSKDIAKKELDEAQYDLNKANSSFNLQDYKWTEIKAYYSCFHAARSLLFLIGLKERSHYCIYVALSLIFKEYFTEEELSNYKNELERRELADYYASYSKEEASSSKNFAKNFFQRVKELYNKLKDLDSKDLIDIRDSMKLEVLRKKKEEKKNTNQNAN